ncbi:hypothetical protein IFM89_034663 [Coptis chinensis]|uniref:Uncharacterized protein n=1 Tax=Coptis chinensis TaxID=261450 RepID=A0A835HPW4_9MAGN|nr:hypothetical protein IFM89_034663 [Coptis chinensis]
MWKTTLRKIDIWLSKWVNNVLFSSLPFLSSKAVRNIEFLSPLNLARKRIALLIPCFLRFNGMSSIDEETMTSKDVVNGSYYEELKSRHGDRPTLTVVDAAKLLILNI